MSYSIVIPMVETIHFRGLRICGVSKRGSRNVSIHYKPSGKIIGRTVRNGFGEPNHFGARGEIRGYTRNKSRSKIVHYDKTGRPVGYSRRVCWLLWVHFGMLKKKDVIFHLW